MAILAKVSPDYIANAVGFKRGAGLLAGEALVAGDAVRLHTDGKIYKAVSTSKTTRTVETGAVDFTEDISDFEGFVFEDYAAGEPVTVFGRDSVVNYGSGMTPRTLYFVAGAGDEGKLSDAAIATNDTPVAMAISATKLRVLR